VDVTCRNNGAEIMRLPNGRERSHRLPEYLIPHTLPVVQNFYLTCTPVFRYVSINYPSIDVSYETGPGHPDSMWAACFILEAGFNQEDK